MKLLIKNVKGLQLPVQANPSDAGYDLVATTDPIIVGEKISRPIDGLEMWKRIAYIEYGTSLYIAPENETIKTIENFHADAGGALCDVVWKEIGVEYHTQLFPRSSLSKFNLVLANSVATIDHGYRGQLLCRFKYMFQPEDFVVVPESGGTRVYGIVNRDHIYNVGDKIIQIKACPNIPIEFLPVDDLNRTTRGDGGFGSSGK